MKKTIEKHYRFKQPAEDGSSRCSVVINGEYHFEPSEIKEHELVESFTITKIYYKNGAELSEAMKQMPDYKCWDSDKKVLIK